MQNNIQKSKLLKQNPKHLQNKELQIIIKSGIIINNIKIEENKSERNDNDDKQYNKMIDSTKNDSMLTFNLIYDHIYIIKLIKMWFKIVLVGVVIRIAAILYWSNNDNYY